MELDRIIFKVPVFTFIEFPILFLLPFAIFVTLGIALGWKEEVIISSSAGIVGLGEIILLKLTEVSLLAFSAILFPALLSLRKVRSYKNRRIDVPQRT